MHELAGLKRGVQAKFPNATVIDLVYHLNDRTLFAATYGRSLWRLKLKAR